MKTQTAIKEDEIRPDELFETFIALSAEDAQNFFEEDEFEAVSCPACGDSATNETFKKHGFTYNACKACGSLYVSPRPTPQALLRYYAQSQSQKYWVDTILKRTAEKREASILQPNYERILTLLKQKNKQPKTVVDVGASWGAFLNLWKSYETNPKLIGIEPGEDAAQKCRAKGITVFEDFVENIGEGDVQGDLVTCFEVVEHVQQPAKFVKALCNVTAPGGMCVVTCLGADGFDIQVLWEQSRSIMPPYHLNFLSAEGMKLLFEAAGFSKVQIMTPGRLDVAIVQKALGKKTPARLSRFEKLLLSRGEETLKAFQEFLATNKLSSHVWILAER